MALSREERVMIFVRDSQPSSLSRLWINLLSSSRGSYFRRASKVLLVILSRRERLRIWMRVWVYSS